MLAGDPNVPKGVVMLLFFLIHSNNFDYANINSEKFEGLLASCRIYFCKNWVVVILTVQLKIERGVYPYQCC